MAQFSKALRSKIIILILLIILLVFGKLHVSSDQENYYSWNKNSIIFSRIAKSVRGQTLHYCITHV